MRNVAVLCSVSTVSKVGTNFFFINVWVPEVGV